MVDRALTGMLMVIPGFVRGLENLEWAGILFSEFKDLTLECARIS